MLPKHANRNRSAYPADARQASDRYDVGKRREDGHPPAANIQAPSDAELIDILQRALRGDPYPVSGKAAIAEPPPESTTPGPLLADRIRDILGSSQPRPEVRPSASLAEPAYSAAHASIPAHGSARPDRAAAYRPEPAQMPEMLQPLPQQERPQRELPAIGPGILAPVPAMRAIVASEHPAEPIAVPTHPAEQLQPANTKIRARRGRRLGLASIGFVAAAALAGAVLPVLIAGPDQYVAASRLQLQTAAISQPGYLDVVAQRIASPHLLSQVVAKLKLDRDPEFTGVSSGPLGIAVDIVSGNGAASDALSRAQLTLRNAINVSENRPSGLLLVSVTTGSAEKSARIANMLADASVYDAVVSQGTDLPGQASAVDASRKAYDQAAAVLASFTNAAGEDKIKAAIDLQQQKEQLGRQAADAEKAVVDARIRLTAAKTAKLSDVLDGSLSPDLRSSPALEALRDRYAAAKTTLSQLSADLGPRHPRLLAQQATVDDLRNNIQTELQRLVTASDADVKTALADQKAAADRMATLGSRNVGVDMARFAQLQDAVEAARAGYENALQGGSAAKPPAAPVPLSVVAPAVAPSAPVDDNLAATQTAGFLMGLGIALCLVFLRTWLSEMLRDGDDSETDVLDIDAEPRSEPVLEHVQQLEPVLQPEWHDDNRQDHRKPMISLEQRFDPAMSVANDRSASVAPMAEEGEDLAALQERMALLRARVEDYAMRRRASRS